MYCQYCQSFCLTKLKGLATGDRLKQAQAHRHCSHNVFALGSRSNWPQTYVWNFSHTLSTVYCLVLAVPAKSKGIAGIAFNCCVGLADVAGNLAFRPCMSAIDTES